MAVVLEGGCRVLTMHEGEPRVSGSLKIWNQIGKASGAKAISLRVLEFGPGPSPGLRNEASDEVMYVLEGNCTIAIDDMKYELGPNEIRPVADIGELVKESEQRRRKDTSR